MVPVSNNTSMIHSEFIEKIRSVHITETELSDRMLLKSLIANYRTGGGLKLSKYGFTLCIEYKILEFIKIPISNEEKNSSLFVVSLDRICESPYYIEGNFCFISDISIATQLTLYCDNFNFLFSNYS